MTSTLSNRTTVSGQTQQPLDPDITILDVGQGNAAIISAGRHKILVDTPAGGPFAGGWPVYESLAAIPDLELSDVFVSHADADHAGGVPAILLDFPVAEIHVNPDGTKQTEVWAELAAAIDEKERAGSLKVDFDLRQGRRFSRGPLEIEVLWPSTKAALHGPGGTPKGERKMDSNSASVVLRISNAGVPRVLLPGDLTEPGWRPLLDSSVDLSADLLVFPHHGGQIGQDSARLAAEICRRVRPSEVVFSIRRGGGEVLLPEVVRAVRAYSASAVIACTQLSMACLSTSPLPGVSHLSVRKAHGKKSGSCCAGSLTYSLASMERVPTRKAHAEFLSGGVPARLCAPLR